MSSSHLAQLNIARLVAPLESPALVDFVANLERINALADNAPGFVWRLQTEDGDATGVKDFGDDFIVNMSVWKDVESLRDYAYRSSHVEVMRRRKEWFLRLKEAYMVLWWVPIGHVPSLEEAELRLAHIRMHGPTAHAFTFKKVFAASDSKYAPDPVSFDGACPAG